MSEVKRYDMDELGGGLVARPDGAWYHFEDFDRVTAERDALQQLLNVADERVNRLEELLRDINGAPGGSQFKRHIEAVLKPAEGGGDEAVK